MIADMLPNLPLILAEAAAGGANQQPIWAQIMPFVFIIGIFYFMLIRPQMKAKKEQDKMISSAKTGDKVITTAGILGTISNVKEKTVIVKVADNVKIEVLKSHLATITTSENGSTEN